MQLGSGSLPLQWKVAQIIIIHKSGKNPDDVQSYRPISLLSIPSKIFEILLLQRMIPLITNNNLIPKHQFRFRPKHATVDQVHRLVKKIHSNFEAKKYCSTAFLDISQAFDKVWHDGLLYKIKLNLPVHYFIILKSYLQDRYFMVKHGEAVSQLHQITSGVPQGSVLGPTL